MTHSDSGSGHRALSVLIIEDDSDSAASLTMILDFDGHHVRAAPDGAGGLRLFDEEPADVVLLDIGLPDMDGFEVARRIRKRKDGPRPLIVAVTGYGQKEDRLRSYEAGVDLHLVKPVDVDELQAILARYQDVSPLGR